MVSKALAIFHLFGKFSKNEKKTPKFVLNQYQEENIE
jgi:hypothetical protein